MLNEDCEDGILPDAEANFCAPDVNFGQIDRVFVGLAGNPLTDFEDLTEWNDRLENVEDTPLTPDLTKIRYLNVIGDKPAADKPVVEISQGRKVYPAATHTVNVEIDETGPVNYSFLKTNEQSNQTYALWYTAGKYIYGGNSGVPASLILDDVIPQSKDELQKFIGAFSWDGYSPDRGVNPFV